MQTRTFRWAVEADGEEIGSIHAETLLHLRDRGLVDWRPSPPGERFDPRQFLSDAGRAYLARHAAGGADGGAG